MNCKQCIHYEADTVSRCRKLKTESAELNKPDLGQNLRGCDPVKKKKEEPATEIATASESVE